MWFRWITQIWIGLNAQRSAPRAEPCGSSSGYSARMQQTNSSCRWLPDHQSHVIGTLAHVDRLIEEVGRLLAGYLRPGPLTFASVVDGHRAHVVVKAIAPVPEAVPRCIADCLNQLRGALEHSLYAEVEHILGRTLVDEEVRAIEFPACTTETAFTSWLNHRVRRRLAPFQDGTELVNRIRRLQPFQRRTPDDHPLRVLAEHTNAAKHRAPVVAMTRLGAVVPEVDHPDLTVAIPLRSLHDRANGGLPISLGDVIASGPRNVRIPVDIWPMFSVQRPHTGAWPIAMKELGWLETWIRTTAIPVLVAGTNDVPELPPELDITVGYEDIRTALSSAGTTPAVERDRSRWVATAARSGLVEILTSWPNGAADDVIRQWVDTLGDDEVVQRVSMLGPLSSAPDALTDVVTGLLAEADTHAKQGR
ncbi:hypothetical protein Br6_04892 [Rhodococcus sp. Br-6]|nr:hypothetical protein Br6_04892 [Rhodococcus sp. Br-6]